ncbi:hypothetical protein FEF65_03785 [Mariprofundus erugo]|uniref:ASCH domain-containing protein n=1 Tax=Mariprofundus erugo TaxID=2528639 RepID=A0A5R9GVE3_9PROT|nr:AAA family ATPase [Mariprofundus erugo]TLS68127.1 hypothetical protein FEF65_03785 [Mariprofundus erugo]
MSRYALISIHPEHVSNILAGNKVFEFRKVIPSKDVSHLVLYCTAPVKKIVAVAEVVDCLVGAPSRIWTQTSYGSGISRQFFRDYFSGQRSASAFVLGNVYEMTTPMELSELTGQKVPPQSFYYLDDADMELISKRQSPIPAVSSSMLFVGGIHGVGKSTICQKAFGPLGYQCETASSLIAAHGRRIEKEKRVNDVSDNQTVLLQQLQSAKEQYCRLLLDGHFTLINSQGQIEPIETAVFEAMNPGRLILIKGDTEEISRRLAARDNKKWDASFLTKFQNAEEGHARYVAEKIQVPLLIFENTIGCARLARKVHGRRG